MIELLGITIHDPDVAVTDFGQGALGAYLGLRLWGAPGRLRSLLRAAQS
jgi:hypothetical protein